MATIAQVLQQVRFAQNALRPAILERARIAEAFRPDLLQQQLRLAEALRPDLLQQQLRLAEAFRPDLLQQQLRLAEAFRPDLLQQQVRLAETFRPDMLQQQAQLAEAFRPDLLQQQLRLAEAFRPDLLQQQVRLAEAFRPDVLRLQVRLAESLGLIGKRISELAASLVVDLRKLIGRMRLRAGLNDAVHYLEVAEDTVENSDDEREYPRAIHRAVGALEETARQLAGMPTATLDAAVRALVRRRVISRAQGKRMLQAYRIRHDTPGAGHGAGRAPRGVAEFVLLRVRHGIRDLLDAFGVGDED